MTARCGGPAANQINKAQYELDFANKKITEEEKNSLVKQADEQQFEATKSLYEREAAIAGQKPQQRQQINNKIETWNPRGRQAMYGKDDQLFLNRAQQRLGRF